MQALPQLHKVQEVKGTGHRGNGSTVEKVWLQNEVSRKDFRSVQTLVFRLSENLCGRRGREQFRPARGTGKTGWKTNEISCKGGHASGETVFRQPESGSAGQRDRKPWEEGGG